MGLTMLVKPVGLVTQMLLASYFGAGSQYDAFALAFFLVTFFEASIGRVYNGVVVPATIRLRRELDSRALMGYQNGIFLLFLLPAVVFLTVLVTRPAWILDLIAPNLPADSREYVLGMVPRMAVGGVALLMVTMGKAILQLNRRFRVAGAMPVTYSAVMLLVLVLTHRQLGIWALPVGFVAANLVQLLIIGAAAFRSRCAALARPHFPPGTLSKIWSVGWLFLAAQILITINLSIDKFFASGLAEGGISAIAYSMTIINMGVQLFSLSLVVVMFTRMSEYLAAGESRDCSTYIYANLNRLTKIVVPVSLSLCLASKEIVRVLFQRGAFDAADAALTSGVLSLYLLGLPALIVNSLVSRIYHSLQRMRDKVWLNAQYLLTNVVGNILLIGSLQVRGLAISSTLAINIHLALGFLVLYRYRTGLAIGRFGTVVGRSYVLAVLTYLVYVFSGFGGLLDSWGIATSVPGALLVAAVRFFFVVGVYASLYFAWIRFSRGSERR